jgi:hypothetical protein
MLTVSQRAESFTGKTLEFISATPEQSREKKMLAPQPTSSFSRRALGVPNRKPPRE